MASYFEYAHIAFVVFTRGHRPTHRKIYLYINRVQLNKVWIIMIFFPINLAPNKILSKLQFKFSSI